jgi:hypothetical protein
MIGSVRKLAICLHESPKHALIIDCDKVHRVILNKDFFISKLISSETEETNF